MKVAKAKHVRAKRGKVGRFINIVIPNLIQQNLGRPAPACQGNRRSTNSCRFLPRNFKTPTLNTNHLPILRFMGVIRISNSGKSHFIAWHQSGTSKSKAGWELSPTITGTPFQLSGCVVDSLRPPVSLHPGCAVLNLSQHRGSTARA